MIPDRQVPRDISSSQLWLTDDLSEVSSDNDDDDSSLGSCDSFSDDSDDHREEPVINTMKRSATFHNGCPSPAMGKQQHQKKRWSEGNQKPKSAARTKDILARLSQKAGRGLSPKSESRVPSSIGFKGSSRVRAELNDALVLTASPMRKFRDTTRGTDCALSHSRSCHHSQRRRRADDFDRLDVKNVHSQPSSLSKKRSKEWTLDDVNGSNHSRGDASSGIVSNSTRWTSVSAPIKSAGAAASVADSNSRVPSRKISRDSLSDGYHGGAIRGDGRSPPIEIAVTKLPESNSGSSFKNSANSGSDCTLTSTARPRPQIPARRKHGAPFRVKDIMREAQQRRNNKSPGASKGSVKSYISHRQRQRPIAGSSNSLLNLMWATRLDNNNNSNNNGAGKKTNSTFPSVGGNDSPTPSSGAQSSPLPMRKLASFVLPSQTSGLPDRTPMPTRNRNARMSIQGQSDKLLASTTNAAAFDILNDDSDQLYDDLLQQKASRRNTVPPKGGTTTTATNTTCALTRSASADFRMKKPMRRGSLLG